MNRLICMTLAALVVLPLLLGCGEKNTYKRNVDFLNDSFLDEERQVRNERLGLANKELSEAVAGGDGARIETARAEYQLAWERLEIVAREIREREKKKQEAGRPRNQ
ncbi:MAG: hypothetical protein HQK81_07805 [Desulfovibrionaceae bacterium]|nr:hypothetical protein [Desulfovibrionaceae bacterium]MBF0513955.1 hypothetical protein [Desulfovibrionaceae bacterium]